MLQFFLPISNWVINVQPQKYICPDQLHSFAREENMISILFLLLTELTRGVWQGLPLLNFAFSAQLVKCWHPWDEGNMGNMSLKPYQMTPWSFGALGLLGLSSCHNQETLKTTLFYCRGVSREWNITLLLIKCTKWALWGSVLLGHFHSPCNTVATFPCTFIVGKQPSPYIK